MLKFFDISSVTVKLTIGVSFSFKLPLRYHPDKFRHSCHSDIIQISSDIIATHISSR